MTAMRYLIPLLRGADEAVQNKTPAGEMPPLFLPTIFFLQKRYNGILHVAFIR
jgi:hypothetical protein